MFVCHLALGRFIQMKTADEVSSMVLPHGNEVVIECVKCTRNAPAMHHQAIAMTQCMNRPYQPHVHTKPQTPCHIFNAIEKFNAIWEHIHHFNSECCLPCLKAPAGVRGFSDAPIWGFTVVFFHRWPCPRCSFTRCRRSSKSTRHFFGIYACPGRADLGQVSTSGFWRSFPRDLKTTKNLKQRKCEEELQYVKARTQHPPKPASQKCHKRSCLSPFLLCSSYHRLCIQLRFRGFSLQTSIIRHMLVYTPW